MFTRTRFRSHCGVLVYERRHFLPEPPVHAHLTAVSSMALSLTIPLTSSTWLSPWGLPPWEAMQGLRLLRFGAATDIGASMPSPDKEEPAVDVFNPDDSEVSSSGER